MKNIIVLFFLLLANFSNAQTFKVTGQIFDDKHAPLANVTIEAGNTKTTSQKNGAYELNLSKGNYSLTFQYLGYQKITKNMQITGDIVLDIAFSNATQNIDEVYITAQESKNLNTSSVITKEAMQLLQPSSFADLLELLPGGRAQDPNLTSFNGIKLRELNLKDKTITSDKYDMSSLGISFYVDGAPINTSSDLQSLANYSTSTNNSKRDNTNKGLDLRTLSTDDIEKVTIVRGIPSVEYGDLTSGLVLIERKKGQSRYNLRAKTDGFGKLFALSKGYSFAKNWLLNYDIGYIASTSNPTNSFENFNRATGSLRIDKTWNAENIYNFQSNIDYNTTLDKKKIDPDNSYLLDKYYSRKQRYAINNQLNIIFNQKQWVDNLLIVSSLSMQKDIIDEDRWIQGRTASVLANSLTQGSHEAQFTSPFYLSNMKVEGLPFTAFTKLVSQHHINFNRIENNIKVGLESTYSKNYGKGQVYDLNFPASANTEVTARPRAFKDIPGYHSLAAFAEDNVKWRIHNFNVEAVLGIRAFSMTSLSKSYTMSAKIYAEPRTNINVYLPPFLVDNKPFQIIVGGGVGVHKKTPTIDQLYPNLAYRDIVELNFYHSNPDFRLAQAYTHIINPTNYNITPATNNKYEVNTDIEFDGNRLSLTLFKEKMSDGFRLNALYQNIAYKQYDNTSIDLEKLNQKPTVADFEYQEANEYYAANLVENGSEIVKKGLEFQFTSRRFKGINTRFTLNGAYYNIQYHNSLPIWKIDRDIIHNNHTRQVVAQYEDDEGYNREMLNSNLTIDSYLPTLGLNLSASFQALWYTVAQNRVKSGIPIAYKFANDGIERPFTDASLADATLMQLVEAYNVSNSLRFKEPLDLQINIKASKRFKNYIRASVFVNRLLLYRPNYTSALGTYINRQMDAPYFGMEITVSL